MGSEKTTLRFALYSSIALAILTIITWGFAMMAVPPSGPYCPGDCMTYPFSDLLTYYPRDYRWMYMAIFQLFDFLIFIVSMHFIAPLEKKLFSFISVSFTIISVIVLLIAYFTQFAIVPISVMKGETEGIALITQYNGHGLFIALEELGYMAMSISFVFLALIFSNKKGIERTIRAILLVQFVFTVITALFYLLKYGIDREYRFEVATITINWLVIISTSLMISFFIRNRLKQIKQ